MKIKEQNRSKSFFCSLSEISAPEVKMSLMKVEEQPFLVLPPKIIS